jgi:hypothetical protein
MYPGAQSVLSRMANSGWNAVVAHDFVLFGVTAKSTFRCGPWNVLSKSFFQTIMTPPLIFCASYLCIFAKIGSRKDLSSTELVYNKKLLTALLIKIHCGIAPKKKKWWVRHIVFYY